ncbi:MAG: hypothetical protein WC595_00535 [Candidatus Nanoarchaeia archaeon]
MKKVLTSLVVAAFAACSTLQPKVDSSSSLQKNEVRNEIINDYFKQTRESVRSRSEGLKKYGQGNVRRIVNELGNGFEKRIYRFGKSEDDTLEIVYNNKGSSEQARPVSVRYQSGVIGFEVRISPEGYEFRTSGASCLPKEFSTAECEWGKSHTKIRISGLDYLEGVKGFLNDVKELREVVDLLFEKEKVKETKDVSTN